MNEGDRVPPLAIDLSDGTSIDLGNPGGRTIVYFYPKDDTPGCTIEAKDFSALAGEFEAAGVKVVGVSRDAMKRHDKFIAKYALQIPLASDEDERISQVFDTWVQKSLYGRKYMGMERSTFLIGADGRVERVWRGVKAKSHAADVLEAVRG